MSQASGDVGPQLEEQNEPRQGPQREGRRQPVPVAGAARIVIGGYDSTPGPEQALFGMSTSFAVTIATSRILNYVRERRRALPRMRSRVRWLLAIPSSNAIRVHHFLPGMAIGFTVAGTALLVRPGRLERLLSLPLGVGFALTTDELRLLVGRNDPYWGRGQRFAHAQGAVALLAALGIGADIVRRGRQQPQHQ
ncbi:hypothetical protein GCM10012285_27660 [Streptomyces kronopolitis]|uniref:Uncharacterized protein n=1 Tax=Streptomyces kronopolitis TaxID=1612435 RepID=A0ABQ2JCG4_9ACTN|nr:hypothetical protein [Streptomyces kronopolitis]GGN44767.1 hypothetical protein GCM10012285_27660 [Streptomyces kronopolitis]